jgi:uncharacterized RDD family membrane protein YckC
VSASLQELTVGSATGIDVSLPVAGAGARAYAFLIDWCIRVLIALAWFSVAALIYNGSVSLAPPLDNDARWFGAVLAPPLAIYFLYHYLLELLTRGRTPGKRMAGVRVISRDGGTPSVAALLIRNVFRLIDSLPLFYGVGLIAVIATPEHRRIGDVAAGTVLAYEAPAVAAPTASELPAASARYDALAAELVAELLQRWPLLTSAARRRLALQLLSRQGVPIDTLTGADDASLHAHLAGLAVAAAQRPT